MRRFDARRQSETETLVEFEMALRLLYKEAWPTSSADIRDAALKRRFEDGVSSVELSQYLKLHHRNLDFSETVEKARIYAATMDSTKSKKSVRFNDVRPPSPSVNYVTPSSSVYLSPLLDQLKQIQGQLSKMKSDQPACRPSASTTQPGPPPSQPPPPAPPTQSMGQRPPPSARFGGPPPWRFNGFQQPRFRPPPPQRFGTQPAPPSLMGPRASTGQFATSGVGPRPGFGPRPHRGCFVCGRYGCHTMNHVDDGQDNNQHQMSRSAPASPVPPQSGKRFPESVSGQPGSAPTTTPAVPLAQHLGSSRPSSSSSTQTRTADGRLENRHLLLIVMKLL